MSETYNPKNRKRKKTHGFLRRAASILKRRRRKGRKHLAV